MSRKAQEIKTKKVFILKCVLELLESNPTEDVTIKHIAEKAEYSRGNLYLYFRNKDEILLSLCYVSLCLWTDILTWASTKHDHHLIKLAFVGESRKAFLDYYPIYYRCNYLSDKIDFSNVQGSLYLDQIAAVGNQSKNAFQKIVEEGINRNEIKPVVQPNILICLLESFSEGIFNKISRDTNSNNPFCDTEELHREYISFIGNSLKTENDIDYKLDKESFHDEMLRHFPKNIDLILNKYIL